jgi:hypothetical protein
MRDDIDSKTVVKLHLIGRTTWTHPNGTIIRAGDYNGYRSVMKTTGQPRVFLALQPGDLTVDWIDVTDQVNKGYFIMAERNACADRLVQKLGLLQSPGMDGGEKFRSTCPRTDLGPSRH